MSTTLSLPPIGTLARSAAELVRTAEGNTARVNALNKAMLHLHEGVAPVPTFGGFLLASGTRGGLVHRISTIDGCSCEAARSGKSCWHAALIDILEDAGRHTMPALVSTPLKGAHADRYSRALAEMDELFPHR